MKQKSLFPALVCGLLLVVLSSGDVQAIGGPKFLNNFDDAVAKASATGKPLIVIFSASWCPACQQMKKSVYPSKQVAPYHDQFVWAYLDTDKASNGPAMTKFRAHEIPHLVFLKPNGSKVGQLKGSVSPDSFAKTLEGVLRKTGKSLKK